MANTKAQSTSYRHRRSHLFIGVGSVGLFSIFGIVSTVAALWNIDGSFPEPRTSALVLALFWSLFTLLGVWLILAYFREVLTLDPTTITHQGVIRRKSLPVDEVIRVKWRRIPAGGSIVIRSAMNKVAIDFGDFTDDDRNEVIHFFHEEFPEDVQDGWLAFEADERESQARKGQRSTANAIICSLLFFACAAVFTWCWFVGMGVQWLVIGVLCAVAGLWYVWRLRRWLNKLANQQSRTDDK